jgi:hypothetical protein
METRQYTVYKFSELSEDGKEKAIQNLADINVDYEWWESTYDDAENIGLKIHEFDIDRGAYCRMTYVDSLEDVIAKIISDHGKDCETAKTAREYQKKLKALDKLEECDYEDARDELRDEFLHDISEDYRIILQHEYEYLTAEKAIIETIEANDYDFTEDGQID